MDNSFYRVSQSLRADNGLRSITSLVIALALLTLWLVWAFRARVTRYEISDSARLEINGAAYPVQANLAGRLVRNRMALGREVHAGEVLAELESDDQRLSLEQEQTHLAALEPQLAALHAQTETENQGRTDERRVLNLSTESARAQYRQAQTEADFAEKEAARALQLRAEGIVSDADAQRAQSSALSKRAAAENLRVLISRLEPELVVRERSRDVRLKQLAGEIARVNAEAAASRAAIERLKYEINRREVRAPISGRLGECAPLRAGAHISEGQQFGIILPPGKLQIIAEFQPSAALGKVKRGQHAVVRLQGFPWAQYGTVPARVSQVASDIREGKVRVELAVLANPRSRIPFQHGLPGSVEVEVERVSPAALVLRSAGELVGAR